MNTGSFDTLAIARTLEAAGFSQDQAEAVTGLFFDAWAANLSNLATKAELFETKAEFRREIAEAKFKFLKWVVSAAIGFQTIFIVGALVTLTMGQH